MIDTLFFIMPLCVIALSGYDCDWDLIVTSYDSVEAYCPSSSVNNTWTVGCADFADKRIVVLESQMDKEGYDGMNNLWHEIKHAHLYSECMRQWFVSHFKCALYADWHG